MTFLVDFENPEKRVHGDQYPDHPMEWFWRVESMCVFMHKTMHPSIHFERYALYRHTPQGVWVVPYDMRNAHFPFEHRQCEALKRFVLIHSDRKFAYPTKAEAWRSFCIRQKWRIRHAENALERAYAVRSLAHQIDEQEVA